MAEKIEFEIDTKTGEAQKSIAQLADAIEGLTKTVKESNKTNQEGFEEVSEELEDLTEEVDGMSEAFSNLGSNSVGILDGMFEGFSGAIDGIKGATKGLNSMSAVLKASPLFLLVGALSSIYAYFTQTTEGAKIFKGITEGISAVVSTFRDEILIPFGETLIGVFKDPQDAVLGFYESIKTYVLDQFNLLMDSVGLLGDAISKLFEGDFSGAFESAKEGALGLGEAVLRLNPATGVLIATTEALIDTVPDLVDVVIQAKDAYIESAKAGERLAETEEKLRKATNEQTVEYAQLGAAVAKADLVLRDYYASFAEKEKALNTRTDAIRRQIEGELELAKLDESRIRQALALEGDLENKKELESELAEAIANRIELTGRIAEAERDYQNELKQIQVDELDRRRDIADTIQSLNRDTAEETVESRRQADLTLSKLDEERDIATLMRAQATEEEINQLKEEYLIARQRINEMYDRDEVDRVKDINATIRELELELLGESLDAERERRNLELLAQEEDTLLELSRLEATEEEKEKVREYYRQLRLQEDEKMNKEIRDMNRETLKEQIEGGIEASDTLLSAIQDFNDSREVEDEASAKRQFEVNKALSKAQVIISTGQAVMNQLAVPQDALTGMNFVKAASITAAGIMQLSKINQTSFDGGGSIETEVGGVSGQTPQIDLSFLQQQNNQQSVRAYVVGQDVQNTAMVNQQIQNQANL